VSDVTTVGIDLAKNVFSLHGVDSHGNVLVRRTISRSKLLSFVAQLPPCVIGVEACSGAHEWARQFRRLGHDPRLMSARFVRPYRKSGKNDGNDAEAICEAVSRPSMRFVPIKSVEQQAILTLHRVRQGFIEERTATINRIRGLIAEFGVALPQRATEVRRGAAASLEQLPTLAAGAVRDLLDHVQVLEDRIGRYQQELEAHTRIDPRAQRIQALSGIGAVSASAIVASVSDAREFTSARQFAAWLGLVPRQYSTGGKARLGHITKRGDTYLRTLLILGARSALRTAAKRADRLARWALSVKQRRGYHRACVAIAAKNARIIWALLARNEPLRPAAA
jgi:transposase